MARIKGGLGAKKRHNRVLKLAKGYRGARSKQDRVAKQSVMRALTSSYAGRKERKRQFRQLWIARINAAARLNGLSYSKFMYGCLLYTSSPELLTGEKQMQRAAKRVTARNRRHEMCIRDRYLLRQDSADPRITMQAGLLPL